MRKIFFLFFLLTYTLSYSQVEETEVKRDSVSFIETTHFELKTEPARSYFQPVRPGSMKIYKKTFYIENYVLMRKEVLDSLLKPYYIIRVDTAKRDTLFIPKYRAKVNKITLDTSYVKKPTQVSYINTNSFNGIDTIEVFRDVKTVNISKINRVIDPAWWINENSIGLDVNEVAFMNWSAGGDNAISGLLKVNFNRTYENERLLWKSEMMMRYGLNMQEGRELRKTNDEFRLNSSLGYRSYLGSDWYYTMKFNFYTQFTDGYKYPDTETPISRFFAPAYLFFGAGAQYNLKPKHFTVYMSPLTFKSTFVLDDDLSDEGAFGVEKGKRSRIEFGTLIQSHWQVEVIKNVAMENKLSFYSDYINNFGNIDVDWQLNFKFKINEFFEAGIGTHLIYDDDIKYKEVNDDGDIITYGARVQFKQQLVLGVLLKF